MALPPEPIEEVLPQAALVVEAEVESILSTGPAQPPVQAKPGATGAPGRDAPDQTVKLRVTKVHKGPAGLSELVVLKPVAGYALRAGNKGPFLLDDAKPHPVILGRYGPDTWNLGRVLEGLGAAR
ncbi:MAG TPA: hypothetical protein DFS52_13205 [Myxococcales bacterium]|jgi:hypothetical protein|nr:hypothetical protein [Myxococcales bacterium]